ncbi:hypothetical protein ACQBAT_07520 [Ornithinimicrobium sp. Y1847]|uniref:hypothetical protein n=1 Tax=Ornithinimicrobium sp. Y1847 TaxID=3405419 RepID=UPI003B6804EB
MAGIVFGAVFGLVVPFGVGWLTLDVLAGVPMVSFPIVLLAIVTPIMILAHPRSRTFGVGMLIGFAVAALLFGVLTVALFFMLLTGVGF